MLQAGVVSPSNSPYSAPVLLAQKKDGTMCFCVDFQRLNVVTTLDVYLLPAF
jgi:hypothetical protein